MRFKECLNVYNSEEIMAKTILETVVLYYLIIISLICISLQNRNNTKREQNQAPFYLHK